MYNILSSEENMKRITTLLIFITFAITSIFAKTAQTQLNTSVDIVPLSYTLYYGQSELENGVEGYTIYTQSLAQANETEAFSLYATSNLNEDQSIVVKVHPHSFKTKLNGTTEYDSKIEPQAKTIEKLDVLTAGKHDNLLVNKFVLTWGGKSDLPAGDYISNVYIYYSIK
jgi:hypothetical protein